MAIEDKVKVALHQLNTLKKELNASKRDMESYFRQQENKIKKMESDLKRISEVYRGVCPHCEKSVEFRGIHIKEDRFTNCSHCKGVIYIEDCEYACSKF